MSDDQETGSGQMAAVSGIISADDAWLRQKDSYDPKAFSAAWVEVQAKLIGDAALSAAVVFGKPDQGPFEPMAIWPKGSLGSPVLVESIEKTINQRSKVIKNTQRASSQALDQGHIIACPLLVEGQVCGAVAFELSQLDQKALNTVLSQLEWGAGWLEVNVHRNKFTSSDRLVTVLELIATSLHHDHFEGSASAVATELAGMLGCERVAIGFLKGQHAELRALSHSAMISKKANVVRMIEATMDEAIEQHATIVYPPPKDGALQVTKAHEVLAAEQQDGSICSIPLSVGERLIGALVLERPKGELFDASTISLCEHAASLLGPLLDTKRKDDRWIGKKVGDSFYGVLQKLFGPRHAGLKFGMSLASLLLLFLIFAKGDYRVTADARLEGTVQRAIAVPIAGYVVEAQARAGDIVKAGDPLFSLDDRDLRLERLKWRSQRLKSSREYSEAVAQRNRAKAKVLEAQIQQADAEIALLDEQLSRTKVTAPFDSFIVSGDLSQSLGAPVERGDVLFEIAPLDSYRVILEVDERDIVELAEQQTGQLALTSAPDQALAITVSKITPISTARDGSNFFRVEAVLNSEVTPQFRPGLEGVAKVDIEQRNIFWIWTHKITHWLKMFFWSWLP